MSKTITCADCSATRHNAAYANTRYCKSCRLLRDFQYLGDATKPCSSCDRQFAPTSRRDSLCGKCCYGSIDEGRCIFCKDEHAELYRAGTPVCVKCIRDPSQRRSIFAALRKGQRERRLANGHRP